MASLAQRRYALQAADELLNDLEIDQEQPVDVFDIIDRLGLWLVFNRLDALLGATIPKGRGGIMLTTQRGPSVQRYTAAHEIGHWVLDISEPAFDGEAEIYYPTGDREQLAQLFAGQLLMPPPLVFATCARHGLTSDADATAPAVYLIARDMRASYEAAARQLSNLSIISPQTRDSLLARTPAQVKTELCHGHRPRGAVDVWPVELASAGGRFDVTEGDEVVVRLPENRSTGYRWMTSAEIAAREKRIASPAPEPFAGPLRTVGKTTRPEGRPTKATRSAAAVNRALMRVPGNSGARRVLRREDGPAGAAPDVDSEMVAMEAANATSALEDVPAHLHAIDDRFTAGWAGVAPAATRAVRRAIAGRRDTALPDTVSAYLGPAQNPGATPALDASAIPAAATGERLVALQTTGAGSSSLGLTYTSSVAPDAPAAATFHIDVQVNLAPHVLRRRLFLQRALAEGDEAVPEDHDPDRDPDGGLDGDSGADPDSGGQV